MKKNMLKILVFLLLFAVGSTTVRAQYGFGTNSPNPSAEVDVVSTNKGFLPPRMTSDQMAAIPNPAEGLVVYNTTVGCLAYYAHGVFTCVFASPPPLPIAGNVIVSGANMMIGSVLSVSYNYTQNTGVPEGGSRYQWYYATDGIGTNQTALSGAIGNTYTIAAPVVEGAYVAVGVTPVTNGGLSGLQVLSPWRAVINNKAPVFGGVAFTVATTQQISTATAVVSGFTDKENDVAGQPIYQWYRYSDAAGNGKTAIVGATTSIYTYTLSDAGYYIGVGVKPVAITGASPGDEVFSSMSGPVWICGAPLPFNHSAGSVAPVDRQGTYKTVITSVAGTGPKCWIAQNLGAYKQASSAVDSRDSVAGWYWKFNRSQGYDYNTSLSKTTPSNWSTSAINESSNWLSNNDPCTILLGSGWRMPTVAEWTSITYASSSAAYNDVLKIHNAGYIVYSSGTITGSRGIQGSFWSNSQSSNTYSNAWFVGSSGSFVTTSMKPYGLSIRCIKD